MPQIGQLLPEMPLSGGWWRGWVGNEAVEVDLHPLLSWEFGSVLGLERGQSECEVEADACPLLRFWKGCFAERVLGSKICRCVGEGVLEV